jgi:predicted dehydrogenase/threonine dehydrogenase-like Zn-dependent dehydrogenase
LKQIIQSFKTGKTILEDVPAPLVRKGHILVQTTHSLVSLGTERMLVEFGKSNLISKARQQPEKVKMVLDKVKSDGILPTLEAVFNKLEQPIPLGYCNVGKVIEVGEGVSEFAIGDRVASNGPHAEFVCVPLNLAVQIPDNVTNEEACFTVIGSIGLQGIRLLNPGFGETIVVSGLGLIGILSAELLFANGCRVIGFDMDQAKVNLAREKGIEAICLTPEMDPVRLVENMTRGIGADGVLITASTKDSTLVSQAARMSRKRGRIVLVGVTGLELNRSEFYEKELTFQVSCSYGPGRYDENYESRGQDYPLPFVRWTEKRNFEAILSAIGRGVLKVKPLISEMVELENYLEIYGNIGEKRTLASLLKYSTGSTPESTVSINGMVSSGKKGIGIIGAGNFTKMTMLPILKKANANIQFIASNTGVSGTFLARKYGIGNSTTDYKEILKSDSAGLVIITTRHNLHGPMAIDALVAGKDVFVEKPMAISVSELFKIENALQKSGKTISVGFNRRFSPFSVKMKQILGENPGPISVIANMNAGFIPKESWVHDLAVGGGRIVGEACHFVDLISYLTGSKVDSVSMIALGTNPDAQTDNASIHLKYSNGSIGIINYLASGSKAYSKERVEVYFSGKNLILDNFRKLDGYDTGGFSGLKGTQDKGHENMFRSLVELSQTGGRPLIAWELLKNTHLACFAALQSLSEKRVISLSEVRKDLPEKWDETSGDE